MADVLVKQCKQCLCNIEAEQIFCSRKCELDYEVKNYPRDAYGGFRHATVAEVMVAIKKFLKAMEDNRPFHGNPGRKLYDTLKRLNINSHDVLYTDSNGRWCYYPEEHEDE